MQDDDRALLDVETTELGEDPLALGDAGRGVRRAVDARVGSHLRGDLEMTAVLLREPVAGPDEESAQPGVPGIRIAQGAQVLPGRHEGFLDGIVGAIGVTQDEIGDALQAREGHLHQLGEGLQVPAPGPFDERSLH